MKVRDQRRAALLESLDTLLRESSLDEINIVIGGQTYELLA